MCFSWCTMPNWVNIHDTWCYNPLWFQSFTLLVWSPAYKWLSTVFLQKLSLFNLFWWAPCGQHHHSQIGELSLKWIRKPAFLPHHLIWSESSCRLSMVRVELSLISSVFLCGLGAGRIGRSHSDRCLEILTELLALKQEHITSGKTLSPHIHSSCCMHASV